MEKVVNNDTTENLPPALRHFQIFFLVLYLVPPAKPLHRPGKNVETR
jgi:hypothetical protein